MSDLQKYLDRQLENPEFKKAYEESEADYIVAKTLISARIEQNLTQKELARRAGLRQSNISRIESGASSPNVATLQKIARGLGKKLKIEFE